MSMVYIERFGEERVRGEGRLGRSTEDGASPQIAIFGVSASTVAPSFCYLSERTIADSKSDYLRSQNMFAVN